MKTAYVCMCVHGFAQVAQLAHVYVCHPYRGTHINTTAGAHSNRHTCTDPEPGPSPIQPPDLHPVIARRTGRGPCPTRPWHGWGSGSGARMILGPEPMNLDGSSIMPLTCENRSGVQLVQAVPNSPPYTRRGKFKTACTSCTRLSVKTVPPGLRLTPGDRAETNHRRRQI